MNPDEEAKRDEREIIRHLYETTLQPPLITTSGNGHINKLARFAKLSPRAPIGTVSFKGLSDRPVEEYKLSIRCFGAAQLMQRNKGPR